VNGSVAAFVALAVLLVGPAVWVLADARKRGLRRPFFWALLALLGNVIGAVVYVLVRDEQPTQRSCDACGRLVSSGHAACPWCGSLQSTSRRSCGQCRNDLDPGWRFCPYCRTEVGSAAPSA